MPAPPHGRERLYALLGDLPDRARPVSAVLVGQEVRRQAQPSPSPSADPDATYVVEKLILDLNGLEPVPAYFVRPGASAASSTPAAWPVVLYNHSHGGAYDIGKEELLSPRQYLRPPPYAQELTRHGYAALCIDHWCFGERSRRTESEVFKHMLWEGRVLWGMMVYDSLKAVDYLVSRRDVDAARIGTLGISMGSTMAWWLAALDARVKVCVDLCCLTDFHALIESRGLDQHGVYYYVPRLLKEGFTTARINRLIAPRPHLALAGEYDPLTPPAGLDRVDAELRKAYAEAGAPDAWRLIRYPSGHVETPTMRAEVVEFLKKWL